MTLLAVAAERRPAVQQSIDLLPQQQTRRRGVRRPSDGTDRRTDGHRTVTYALRVVSITRLVGSGTALCYERRLQQYEA